MPPILQLPEDCVNSQALFSTTGADFADPLYVQASKESLKIYVCLFTCGSAHAIQLELTEDLTATSFLLAFRRFASRRGLPIKMMSDNAKMFKAVSKEITNIK